MKKKICCLLFILIVFICLIILCLLINRKNKVINGFNDVLDKWRASENVYYSQTNLENKDKIEIYSTKNTDLIIENGKKTYITNNQRIVVDKNNEIVEALETINHITVKNILNDEIVENADKEEPRLHTIFSNDSDFIANTLYNRPQVEETINKVKSGEFEGKKCYVLYVSHDEKIYIDKDNYYLIGFNSRGKDYICELKFDSVKENDIIIPSI